MLSRHTAAREGDTATAASTSVDDARKATAQEEAKRARGSRLAPEAKRARGCRPVTEAAMARETAGINTNRRVGTSQGCSYSGSTHAVTAE